MSYQQNLVRIKAVHDALGELASQVVYIGGATVALYATNKITDVRPTDDIDVLVELTHHRNYADLDAKLRAKGFANDVESGVICRYTINGLVVDIMPTGEDVLGFSNRWYADGFKTARELQLDDAYKIRLFLPVYFLASKLEAFNNRGKGDGRTSSDFEDIVFLLHTRKEIIQEIQQADTEVREYLEQSFSQLSENPYLGEWISSHLDYNEQHRVSFIEGAVATIGQNK